MRSWPYVHEEKFDSKYYHLKGVVHLRAENSSLFSKINCKGTTEDD